MKALNSLRPYQIRLTADGEVLDGSYLFGAVCNSTSIGGLMKLNPERVVLDDGKFELLLIPSPRTPQDLQNLVLALLNQQYDRGDWSFVTSPLSIWKPRRSCLGLWMGNMPPAFPLWKLKTTSGRSQCCYERGIGGPAPSF
ncbi:MAG: hypothetical protein V8R75_06385 [Oscillospiraceae bacterium]